MKMFSIFLSIFLGQGVWAYQVDITFEGGVSSCEWSGTVCSNPKKAFIVSLKGPSADFQQGELLIEGGQDQVNGFLYITRDIVKGSAKYALTAMVYKYRDAQYSFTPTDDPKTIANQNLDYRNEKSQVVGHFYYSVTDVKVVSTSVSTEKPSACVVPPGKYFQIEKGPGRCQITYCYDFSGSRLNLWDMPLLSNLPNYSNIEFQRFLPDAKQSWDVPIQERRAALTGAGIFTVPDSAFNTTYIVMGFFRWGDNPSGGGSGGVKSNILTTKDVCP